MITRENVIDYFMNSALILSSGGSAIILFAGYNVQHAFIGATGQLFYLIMEYVRSQKVNKNLKPKSWLYWVSVLILGAVVSYLGTNWAASKVGLSELLVGFVLGFFSQSLPEFYDLAIDLFKGYLKKKHGGDEKDS
jgi:hypothetical protein